MLEIGITDPKMSSYFGEPDMSGYRVAENLVKIRNSIDKEEQENPNTNLIKKEIIEYIEDEFSSTLIIIKDMFSKYFDGTYKKEDFKYKDILKMQEKRLEAERKRGRTKI